MIARRLHLHRVGAAVETENIQAWGGAVVREYRPGGRRLSLHTARAWRLRRPATADVPEPVAALAAGAALAGTSVFEAYAGLASYLAALDSASSVDADREEGLEDARSQVQSGFDEGKDETD